MKKRTLLWLAVGITAIAVLYLFPARRQNFFEIYGKDDRVSRSLRAFYQKPVKTLHVDGIEWKYTVAGNGNRTLLFIHGMGGAYDLWWRQIETLENRYKIISFTLPAQIDNLEDARKGIEALLNEEKTGRFLVVGTSMGGYIAQYLVKTMPGRIEKAVFGNTFPPNNLLLEQNRTTRKLLPFIPEIIIQRFGAKQFEEKLWPSAGYDSVIRAFLPTLPFSKRAFINRFDLLTDFFTINPARYEIKRIPKLIIQSDNDPLVPEALRKELMALYPGAQVFTFRNKGHFPYLNDAETYNAVLTDFFEKENEFQLIEQCVEQYFEGRKNADTNRLRNIFHPGARLYTLVNDSIRTFNLDNYLEVVAREGKQRVKTKLIDVNLTGKSACVHTEFDYGARVYKDYLTLLKENGRWTIVSKTFVNKK